MIAYSRDHYWRLERQRLSAFRAIAKDLGKDHAITKMMGSLAWGRHSFQYTLPGNLRDAVYALGGVDGVFHVLNVWARDNDQAAQRILHKHYSTSFATERGDAREDAT